jgi:hypothetical protein
VLLEEHSGEEAQRNLWNSGQGSGLRSWIRYLEHLSLSVQRRKRVNGFEGSSADCSKGDGHELVLMRRSRAAIDGPGRP